MRDKVGAKPRTTGQTEQNERRKTNMLKVTVKSIGPSHRQNVLAAATVEFADSDGCSVTIADVRVLQNKLGQRWVALPAFAVPKSGRDFQYQATVELSQALMREVSELVLAAFEAKQQTAQP
jgi:hypothetical protein